MWLALPLNCYSVSVVILSGSQPRGGPPAGGIFPSPKIGDGGGLTVVSGPFLNFAAAKSLASTGFCEGRQRYLGSQTSHSFRTNIRDELVGRTYVPLPARRQEIPKDGGKVRILSIPAIRDRVVQGALKLILEPIFEADFQPGSFGYRPKRTAHEAVDRVAKAIVQHKTRVIDIDLRSYFDNVRHDRLLAKVARRVDDPDVMHLLKIMLKASGRCGVPQGGVISPLLSNLYLTEVDRMLERAKEVTRSGKYTYIEYARFADDLVILIDAYPRHDWLMGAVERSGTPASASASSKTGWKRRSGAICCGLGNERASVGRGGVSHGCTKP